MKKNSKRIQGKTWTFVIYPNESAPPDWENQIRLLHTDYAYSPVHDPDPDNSKPHVHVILQYPHNMGLSLIEDISRGIFNGTQPFLVYNLSQMCKYLTHMEDKWEKIKYDPMSVTWSGIPYIESLMTTSGTPEPLKEIARYLDDHQEMTSYRALLLFALDNDLIFWADYISNHVYQINSLLRSN